MGYSKERIARLMELIKEIEGRREHPNAGATYKDVPALKEIDTIVKEQTEGAEPLDERGLVDSIFLVRFLARSYEEMWRVAYTVEYHKLLFRLHLELKRRFDVTEDECADDYYCALRARNYYAEDPCDDLSQAARELIPESRRRMTEKELLGKKQSMAHDPVELTDEYLAVIDEIDRIMDTPEMKNLHTFVRWEVLQGLFAERGIKWSTPAELNRGFHFD